ncbi:toll-like receptor 13 [Anneissia japonica]|uniref:toll-like receptor 13 n=1 Tax=Anneissia japonica TaxID=1529436 RepID=UPI001425BA48|nr:toll-like receptor 13 [Anneissia japonica]
MKNVSPNLCCLFSMYLGIIVVAVVFVQSQDLGGGVMRKGQAYTRVSDHILKCKFSTNTINCTKCNLNNMPVFHEILYNITFFDLHYNTIQFLGNNSFNETPNVQKINLIYNSLQGIEQDAFVGLSDLQELYLGYNQELQHIRDLWFHTLNSLRVISFVGGNVDTIYADAFKGCWQLKEVHLEGNNIVSIPDSLFRNFSYLQQVYIQRNKIQRLPKNMFQNSNSVEVLWFHDNQIQTILTTSELQTLSNLTKLSVGVNPYNCDCEILWFARWINNPGNVTFLWVENATCNESNTKIKNVASKLKHCDLKVVIVTTCFLLFLVVTVLGFLYAFRWNIRYWNQLRLRRKQYERIKNEVVDRTNLKYDAFISYESNDLDWVLKVLHPTLESNPYNFRLCLDYRDFVVGDNVVNNITNAIKHSRKVVVVVTDNYARSEWCHFELEMAKLRMLENQEDVMIVIQLSDVSPESMSVLLKKEMVSKRCIKWPSCEEGKKVFWVKLGMALQSPNIPCNRGSRYTL